jgi:hypothetical protein
MKSDSDDFNKILDDAIRNAGLNAGEIDKMAREDGEFIGELTKKSISSLADYVYNRIEEVRRDNPRFRPPMDAVLNQYMLIYLGMVIRIFNKAIAKTNMKMVQEFDDLR